MGKRDQAFQDKLDLHMEELRRLHDGAARAADRTEAAADRSEKAVERVEKWTLSLQKRVERLEHWRTALAAGGIVVLYLLKGKAMKVFGLEATE